MPASPSEERAARALRACGRRGPLERAASNANETWLGEGFVLRVNARGDLGRLAREAAIARRLPPEARYPGVLDYGADGAIEWLLAERVPGRQLGRVWPALSERERERAVVELAEVLRALHAVDDPALPADGDVRWPPHVLPLGPLLEQLAEARAQLGDALGDQAIARAQELWPAFADGWGRGLVHGDLHLENLLWQDGRVSALLDLEWGRRSWIQVDLEILLAYCDHPRLFADRSYEDLLRREDYRELPALLAREYPALFDHPRLLDRLVLLALSRELGYLVDAPGNALRIGHVRALLAGTSPLHRLGLG